MKTKIFLFIFLLFCSLLTPHSLYSQRVALVLSGGASKGGAHIGVIRALEEQHIPISYIAGTSIGAIIGALYASGYSPDEMEKLMGSKEFQQWASGIMDDTYIHFYRKEDPNASWISTDFDFGKKLTSILPSHLIKTHEIDYHFMRLFAPANAVCHGNFDHLMVPFRCVVSDIDSTEAVVLSRGDLGTAVRGSMSIPLIFSPVVNKKKLVFDGGMYNNFPVDVVINDFHPDVIIGSRVAQRYDKPERDDIVSQLLVMLMERQNDTINFSRSVMIVPRIPSYGLLDFTHTSELADSGYQAAWRKISDIRKLVTDSITPERVAEKRAAFNHLKPELLFDSIYITGLNKAQEKYVRKILKHGRTIVHEEELRPEYFRFIDEGYVKSIFPVAEYNPVTGNFKLRLDIQKSMNFEAQFGGNFTLGTTNMAFLEFRYKYLWTKALHFMVNGYFGRFYTSAKAEARIDFNSATPWFIEANYTYNNFNYFKNVSFFFDDKTPNYIIESENFSHLQIGMPCTNKGKLALGLTYSYASDKYYQSNVFSRTDTADHTSFTYLAPSFSFELNGLNRKQFANAGARLKLSLSYVNGRESLSPGSTAINPVFIINHHSWLRFSLIYDNYFQSLGPVKLGFYAEGSISNQPLFANYVSSLLFATAFQPLPESQTFFLPAFRANNYIAAGLKMVLRIYKKIEYRLEGYLFQPYQAILENPATQTAQYGKKFSDRAYMASTAVVYNSPLGPLSLGVNYYDKMHDPFTLNFNFGYIIFNKRGMP